MRKQWNLCVCLCGFFLIAGMASGQEIIKKGSALYPPEVVQQVRANIEREAWGPALKNRLIAAAQPWLDKSDDELWALMFGPGITRTWMVWSNGFCPACKQNVPMYTWEIAALDRPWKVRCPHCKEIFPKNDFAAFYASGLNEQGIFEPAKADRALLFNAEHPNADDPLRAFGVDDGEGYVEGENRWRFIGAYLIYGQFKQAVLSGINALSATYVVSGNLAYAHKALILLDRVADVYPLFDFKKQGLVYEQPGVAGYVSTWHDTCEETRQLVMDYDMVFPALVEDAELTAFLSKKAAEHKLANAKASAADIQRNIEGRILQDALNNAGKIHSNYPRTEITKAIIHAVLQRAESPAAFNEIVDAMLEKATAVDGVTGEKGLAGYSSYTINGLAMFLAEFMKSGPQFIPDLLAKHPRVRDMYRFHIDMHCLDRYYPQSGDTGSFAAVYEGYAGMSFVKPDVSSSWSGLTPSTFTLMWRLYETTQDPAFIQVAVHANGDSLEGIPFDIFCADPESVRKGMGEVLAREGSQIKLGSVNKQQWHMAILRSGEGPNRRALWLDYDAGGGHGHLDGLNLGLFAKGLDFLPEFGYPAVQFGGWGAPRARWYGMTAAHNTVMVDGKNQASGAGKTTLWADGRALHAIRAAAPAMNGGQRYERTALLVDVSPEDFYVADLFRVNGGSDHVKFTHSHFGTITTTGLSPQPAPDFGGDMQLRNLQLDPNPQPGWRAEWAVEDRLKLLPEGTQMHARYTDLTNAAQGGLIEAWLVAGQYNSSNEMWLPRVVTRRQGNPGDPLQSTFVSVFETYEKQPVIASVKRMALTGPDNAALGDSHVGLSIQCADGGRDVVILRDPEDQNVKEIVVNAGLTLRTDAELTLVRLDAQNVIQHVTLCKGAHCKAGDVEIALPSITETHEWNKP